jgi:hypothetical protein
MQRRVRSPQKASQMELIKAQSKGIRAARKAVKAAFATATAAVKAATVTPMTVVDPRANRAYVVEGGVCGFAWVEVPRQEGAKALLTAMAEKGLVAYHKGRAMVSHYGQSMTRAEAFAYAFADSLRASGYDVRPGSRID